MDDSGYMKSERIKRETLRYLGYGKHEADAETLRMIRECRIHSSSENPASPGRTFISHPKTYILRNHG